MKYTVFHFEDDHAIAKKYKNAFMASGFRYRRFCYPPKNLIEIVRKGKPDFVIMDTSMPNMDGYAASKLLKEYDDTAKIPILGLSDVDKEAGVRWAVNAQLDDYWLHSEHPVKEVIQKAVSILSPKPTVAITTATKVPVKKIVTYALAILLAISGPLFLYLYFNRHDTTYDKRFPTLTVKLKTNTFQWVFDEKVYSMKKNFYKEISSFYHQHPERVYTENEKLADYYNRLHNNIISEGDTTIQEIKEYFQSIFSEQRIDGEKVAEFLVSFVQSIPYDNEKYDLIMSSINSENVNIELVSRQVEETWPRFPYETLYENKGVCTDKTFLAIALLEAFEYGTALFDFGQHVAPAVQCPKEYSTFKSGYCVAEVTSPEYFIGEVPGFSQQVGLAVPKDAEHFSKKLWNIDLESLDSSSVTVYAFEEGASYELIKEKAPILLSMERIEKSFDVLSEKIQTLKNEVNGLASEVNKYKEQSDMAYEKYLYSNNMEDYYTYDDLIQKYQVHKNQYDEKHAAYEQALSQSNGLITEYQQLLESYKK